MKILIKFLFFNLTLILVALTLWLTWQRPAPVTQAYLIEFISQRSGQPFDYTILPNGQNERRLTAFTQESRWQALDQRTAQRPTDGLLTAIIQPPPSGQFAQAIAAYQIQLGQTVLVQSNMPLSHLLWSPDGRWLAYEKQVQSQDELFYSEVLVYDTLAQQSKLVLRVHSSCRREFSAAWTPDSRALLTHHSCGPLRLTNEVYRIQVNPLQVIRLTNPTKDPFASANSHPQASSIINLPWRPGPMLASIFLVSLLAVFIAQRASVRHNQRWLYHGSNSNLGNDV